MATFLKKSFVTLLISLSLSQFLFACSNRGEIKSWVNPHPWAHCIANHAVIIAKKTIVPKSWVNNNEVLKDLKDEVLFKLYDALENGTLSAFMTNFEEKVAKRTFELWDRMAYGNYTIYNKFDDLSNKTSLNEQLSSLYTSNYDWTNPEPWVLCIANEVKSSAKKEKT